MAYSRAYEGEKRAHTVLTDVRLSANREYFKLDCRELCQRLEWALKERLL